MQDAITPKMHAHRGGVPIKKKLTITTQYTARAAINT